MPRATTLLTRSLVTTALAALTLVGCSAAEQVAPEPTVSEAPGPDRTEVPTPSPTVTASGEVLPSDDPASAGAVTWERYEDGLQEELDALTEDADCEALMEAFDSALADEPAVREASGQGVEDLLSYIADRMADAGCE